MSQITHPTEKNGTGRAALLVRFELLQEPVQHCTVLPDGSAVFVRLESFFHSSPCRKWLHSHSQDSLRLADQGAFAGGPVWYPSCGPLLRRRCSTALSVVWDTSRTQTIGVLGVVRWIVQGVEMMLQMGSEKCPLFLQAKFSLCYWKPGASPVLTEESVMGIALF